MSADVVTGGAVVAGIVAILFALRPYVLRRKNGGNGSAGAKPPEYWEKRYDRLDNAMVRLAEDMSDIKEMLTTLIRRREP